MKKVIFILAIFMVFTLTGCQDKPYEPDIDGFTYIETDTITFDFDNGSGNVELFSYTFEEELKMFVNDEGNIFNFKNINDYSVASDQIEALINTYEDTIQFQSYLETGFEDSVELSTGATEDDYNLVDVDIDDEAYSETAYITTEEGVSIMISYIVFYIDDEPIYVPSNIQLFLNTIHQEVIWEFLPENNEYSEETMKKITYELIVVPLPMKTGAFSTYETILETGTTVDDFTIVVPSDTNDTGTWYPCVDDQVDNCISPSSTIIEIQIHDMFEEDVFLFYEENFGAMIENNEFTFYLNGNAFVLYDIEETQVQYDNDEIVDVVNGKIRLK